MLSINFSKTFFMIISNRTAPQFDMQVKIDNVAIEKTNKHKFLGIIIDANLKFNAHINEISSKIAKSVGILFRLSNFLPVSTLKSLYFAFVHSYLDYCNIVWGGAYNAHLLPLFLLQKKYK